MTEVARQVDLRAEQERSLLRPRMAYSPMARLLFRSFDLLYGRRTTLPKVRLLEILARIPYQAWETLQYARLSGIGAKEPDIEGALDILRWGRAAQDNEFWHLRVIEIRMREEGLRERPFVEAVVPRIACFHYALFSRLLARASLRRAFLLNAEFEDHAEHAYMRFVADRPDLDGARPSDPRVRRYAAADSWGDVFRHIGLDERDHMAESLKRCGRGAEGLEPAPDGGADRNRTDE